MDIEPDKQPAPCLPPIGRLMALDIGSRRVGVALSDPLRTIAQPHDVVQRFPKLADSLRKIVHDFEVVGVLVGEPLTLRGDKSFAAEATHKCVDEIRSTLAVPILYWDERLTTRQAERMMIEQGARRATRRENIDKIAAAILLQSYLDSCPQNVYRDV